MLNRQKKAHEQKTDTSTITVHLCNEDGQFVESLAYGLLHAPKTMPLRTPKPQASVAEPFHSGHVTSPTGRQDR